eukprot:CAMPEP_0174299500 /NCGR_PEP_ID=MMETSP0809-20121228/56832_1 /TAXON_ID=73025 ORGANISM="Eutreptiella gymnastica-like, Strain CCMP1594" /NCGR_SAMPLE_ID=MMETSP0809 /ASSEMBLY_ACC=CAM_ASM_000658 /LENGTH=131 /DNA_ID=CAMNT_0015404703 /DNA_START=90 /DNA_END=482 /DNA_ORIENTATION=-
MNAHDNSDAGGTEYESDHSDETAYRISTPSIMECGANDFVYRTVHDDESECSVEYYGSDCSSDEDKPKPHPLPQKDLSDVKPSMAGISAVHQYMKNLSLKGDFRGLSALMTITGKAVDPDINGRPVQGSSG